jgi:prolyl 4-hydroxylase
MNNLNKNFIFQKKKCLSNFFCEQLISYFETIEHKSPGYVGSSKDEFVDRSSKNSLEVSFSIYEDKSPLIICLKQRLEESLTECCDNYYFSFLKNAPSWKICPTFNIQKYAPTGGYLKPHCEHGPSESSSKRILAWMIYLNNVTDRGGTRFPSQNITLKPCVGDLYIWPAGFTHLHHGVSSPSQIKYIATGWCAYD